MVCKRGNIGEQIEYGPNKHMTTWSTRTLHTHLTQSLKKCGLSAWTMTTSKKSLQSFPTMYLMPLSLQSEISEWLDHRRLLREGQLIIMVGTEQMEWHQTRGNYVLDIFDTVPLQPLPILQRKQQRCGSFHSPKYTVQTDCECFCPLFPFVNSFLTEWYVSVCASSVNHVG